MTLTDLISGFTGTQSQTAPTDQASGSPSTSGGWLDSLNNAFQTGLGAFKSFTTATSGTKAANAANNAKAAQSDALAKWTPWIIGSAVVLTVVLIVKVIFRRAGSKG